jgi:hypothetical protein
MIAIDGKSDVAPRVSDPGVGVPPEIPGAL